MEQDDDDIDYVAQAVADMSVSAPPGPASVSSTLPPSPPPRGSLVKSIVADDVSNDILDVTMYGRARSKMQRNQMVDKHDHVDNTTVALMASLVEWFSCSTHGLCCEDQTPSPGALFYR